MKLLASRQFKPLALKQHTRRLTPANITLVYVKHNPDHEWARLAPEDKGPVIGLTFREFADATHRVARAFRPDGTRANGEVIAVLIHCDAILYLALLVGLVRAGFVVSLTSTLPKRTSA